MSDPVFTPEQQRERRVLARINARAAVYATLSAEYKAMAPGLARRLAQDKVVREANAIVRLARSINRGDLISAWSGTAWAARHGL